MAYFRLLDEQMDRLLSLLHKNESWLILVNADPDALSSAMALKRIMSRRVKETGIAQINVITRPDNLAMIRYTRIPTRLVTSEMAEAYDRFAIVDSQPLHNPEYAKYPFSIILDHHPVTPQNAPRADYVEIRPEYGACATLLTEYLYNLGIKPGKLLATALVYGIKSDTKDFERELCDVDVKAFRYLYKFADRDILKKIVRSEYHMHWLKCFSRAFKNLQTLEGGVFAYMDRVENPDILVILADFFLRVHEISWTAIAGEMGDTLILIFRGDGLNRDVGAMAKELFDDVGSAGGHKGAARAEIPRKALHGVDPETFLMERLDPAGKRRRPSEHNNRNGC